MTPPLFRRRPHVDLAELVVGSRWRLHWPGAPCDVTILGLTEPEDAWYGGFGVCLDGRGTLAFGIFARIAEPLTPA